MGEVYLARMQGASGWQKQLVIKRMLPHLAEDPAFARRFLEENKSNKTVGFRCAMTRTGSPTGNDGDEGNYFKVKKKKEKRSYK
jgi:hypothetical protein